MPPLAAPLHPTLTRRRPQEEEYSVNSTLSDHDSREFDGVTAAARILTTKPVYPPQNDGASVRMRLFDTANDIMDAM